MSTPYLCRSLVVASMLMAAAYSLHAQKTANAERAKLLKAMPAHKDTRIFTNRYTSAYTFDVNAGKVTVTNRDVEDWISLSGNTDYLKPVFYNDHVTLEDTEIKYTNGKNIRYEPVCGNYEVDDIFYSDAKMCSYKINFLNEGSEVSFLSKTRYDDARYLTKVFFHDELPVESREITFTIPNTIVVDLVEKNFAGFDIVRSVTPTSAGKVYTYTLKDMKAMRRESNSLGSLHHYPHILVITKEFKTGAGSQHVIASVNDLYGWYSSLVKDVRNDNRGFQQEVSRLTVNAKTAEDRIKAVYYWVQDNIKYVAFEDGIAGFKPEAAQHVYTNRYGDCKGMANLTKEMLKAAGFDARLVWIGTNRIPYTYDVPTLAVDNHMICVVYNGDKQFILDPTEKFIALGRHAERIQGKEMLIENGESFVVKKVPVEDFNSNLVTRHETISVEGQLLKGTGEIKYTGESKNMILNFSALTKNEDQKRLFSSLAVSNFSNADNVTLDAIPSVDRENPLGLKYTYALTNKVSAFDNDLFVDLDWNKFLSESKIEDERETDYYFNRKVKQITSKKFRVPAGYKVTHLPKGMDKTHNDFSVRVSFEQAGDEVIYNNEITVPHGIVHKNDFKVWNETIRELNDIYNDQIIITKQN